MKLTQKAKLEQFDAILAERDKLRLAVADLSGTTRFSFKHMWTSLPNLK